MVGWDFSRLEGRLEADEPDWDFDAMCVDAMSDADAVLDLGTGGGERLQRLRGRLERQPRVLSATEGWPPNVDVARAALEPLGIEVADYDSGSDAAMPYPSYHFDLVMVRHESYDVDEINRVLRPGGWLLTQQVHGRDAEELRQWFGGESMYPGQTLENHTGMVAGSGLTVEATGEWAGQMRFSDAQTLVEYMALVPWDVPGFSVEPHLEVLLRLDADRPIVVSQRRFWLAARRDVAAQPRERATTA